MDDFDCHCDQIIIYFVSSLINKRCVSRMHVVCIAVWVHGCDCVGVDGCMRESRERRSALLMTMFREYCCEIFCQLLIIIVIIGCYVMIFDA